MNDLVIYHHLGLGDHFICNGLVREWAAKYGRVSLFCKPHNLSTVRQMYSDLDISFLVGDDCFADRVLPSFRNIDLLKVGFDRLTSKESFDQQFYSLAQVDFAKRWTSFKVNRDKKKELDLIYQLNLPPKFAILHEDQSRGYKIDRSKINLPIVRLEKRDNFTMIDWLAVAELAAEVHVIDSSFMFLVDSVKTKSKLFIHRYSRNNPEWQLPTLKNNWTIL